MLSRADEQMRSITGKTGVLEAIALENQQRIRQALEVFSLDHHITAETVSQALLERLRQEDKDLHRVFGHPDFTKSSSVQPIIDAAKEVAEPPRGLFLKKDKASEMLQRTPPPNLLEAFGYNSASELLEKEDFWQVFASLRFAESQEWMNEKFLPQYEELTPSDFERREVKVIFLEPKWIEIAQQFIQKKYHNLSHLKELGLVFVVPLPVEVPGMLTQVFALMLHYLNEIPFYSKLTDKYSREPETFTDNVIAMLRGEVGQASEASTNAEEMQWLIVQRYLAKDDPRDERLFVPHVNPEAIHWEKAQEQMVAFSYKYGALQYNLWHSLDWVGDFFPSQKEGELLVSFDLVDNIMSLVKEETLIKYLYHHQEALWNRLFIEYTGSRDKMEQMMIDNLHKGYIELKA